LTGCDQYLVLPECEKSKKNVYPDGQWVDCNRLIEIESKKTKIDTKNESGPAGRAPLY
jgi:hypothetical protein